MYHLLAGLYAEWAKKPVYNVLLVGLKGSGKTWVLERLREMHAGGQGPSGRIAPTVGQNGRSVLHFWDLGGAASMRVLWDEYLPDAAAVVWVLDAPRWAQDAKIDGERQPTYRAAVCDALFQLAQDAAARNQPIVVVVAQLDQAPFAGPGLDQASGVALVEHVHIHVVEQWAKFVDETTSAATLNPHWTFVGLSAASGDGVPAALDTIHSKAVRYASTAP